jgi:hypothetical protein
MPVKQSKARESFLTRFKELANRRDKDYLQTSIEETLPIAAAFLFIIVFYFVIVAIWGNTPPPLPGRLLVSIFFFISSITGFIIMIRRRVTGSFFTVRRGKLAVLVGFILAFFCISSAFYMLWEALKIILRY